MWVDIEAMPDVKIFKTGTLDDKSALDKWPAVQEIYTRNRPDCIAGFQNAEQKEAS